MIERVSFASHYPVKRNTKYENEIYPDLNNIPLVQEHKESNSGLLTGALVALGAFGIGMLARKPKVVEKLIKVEVPASKNITSKERELLWQAAAQGNKHLYQARKASNATTEINKNIIKKSNPQMRPEKISPELEALKDDIKTRTIENWLKENDLVIKEKNGLCWLETKDGVPVNSKDKRLGRGVCFDSRSNLFFNLKNNKDFFCKKLIAVDKNKIDGNNKPVKKQFVTPKFED